MDSFGELFAKPETLAILCLFGLPIGGGMLVAIITTYFRHRERMALIQQGMHPDFPPGDDVPEQASKPRKFKPSA